MSDGDNSFITTVDQPSNQDTNFGLGAGESGGYVDWDSTDEDFGDASDTTPILLFGR